MVCMTAEKILEIARAQIGVKEDPPHSNHVKFNTAYYDREVSGCARFLRDAVLHWAK